MNLARLANVVGIENLWQVVHVKVNRSVMQLWLMRFLQAYVHIRTETIKRTSK